MFSWTKRPDHTFGLLLYLLAVSAAAAAPLTMGSAHSSSLGAYLALSLLLSVITLAIAVFFCGFRRRKQLRLGFALAGTIILAYAFLDSFFVVLFQRHPSSVDARATLDALRTGTIHLEFADKLLLGAGIVGVFLLVWLLLVGLTYCPRISWLERRETSLVRGLLTITCPLLFFHDLLFLPDVFPGSLFTMHRPDNATTPVQNEFSSEEMPPVSILLDQQFRQLEDLNARFPLALQVREKPDILFLHLESLRSSDFHAELFPQTLPLIGHCLRSDRHYSTGNTTGNGLFGALTGLSAAYAHIARAKSFAPLPLRVLRQFGYTNHVWYPNEALDFDDIRPRLIGTDIQVHRSTGLPRFGADEHTVAGYLARPPDQAARFDYVLLDSTHYDYSYPAEFEIHRPSGTLDFAFNPLTGEGIESSTSNPLAHTNEEQRTKVRNRYKNSLRYLDSLLSRLLAHAQERTSKPLIIAVFGDHGEAFWDRGGPFGHSTALSDAQTRVPFLLCAPDKPQTKYRITSHADIFPTIFDWMGVEAPTPFMTGKSLLRYDPALDYAVLRNIVNRTDASNRYALIEPGQRTGILFVNPPRITWMQNDDEEPLTLVPHRAAHAYATIIGASAFRSPPSKVPR